MTLSHEQARAFYDRFGSKQDAQAFYEDAALAALIDHADFAQAGSVAELGCGTGRFASLLLEKYLPEHATYLGTDVSHTMIDLATERLAPFGERARVALSEGPVRFPLPDRSVDRLVSSYVLDLLSEPDIEQAIDEARRVLATNGKLCLVSLTHGDTAGSRIVSGGWSALWKLSASLVGGCRPIRLAAFLKPQEWEIEYHSVIRQFGVPSEVLVARPK